jgi:hypothetical protein
MTPFGKVGGRRQLVTALVVAAALAVAAPAPASAQSDPTTFTLRGYLRDRDGSFTAIDPPGSVGTKVGDVNDRGELVGTAYPDLTSDTAFGYLRDRRGRYTRIDPPGDELRTVPSSINERGEIVGFVQSADGLHGFVRDRGGRSRIFDHPDAGSSAAGSGTLVRGINDGGTMVGTYIDDDGVNHCFARDRRGRLTTLDHPDADGTSSPLGVGTACNDINDRGDIVGLYAAGGTEHAFVRDHRGRYRTIDVPGAAATSPGAINNRGQIAGTYVVGTGPLDPNGVNHGFLRDRRGRITTIDHPRAAANGTATYGLDDRGRTVGAYTSSVVSRPAG